VYLQVLHHQEHAKFKTRISRQKTIEHAGKVQKSSLKYLDSKVNDTFCVGYFLQIQSRLLINQHSVTLPKQYCDF
jgi:hypothetical protein